MTATRRVMLGNCSNNWRRACWMVAPVSMASSMRRTKGGFEGFERFEGFEGVKEFEEFEEFEGLRMDAMSSGKRISPRRTGSFPLLCHSLTRLSTARK